MRVKLVWMTAALALVACDEDGGVDVSGVAETVLFFDSGVAGDASGAKPDGGSPAGDGGADEDGTVGGDGGEAQDSGAVEEGGAGGDNEPRANGVGLPCDTDADCRSGQRCHQDTVDYIGHGQCTTDCDATEVCEAAHGDLTFCIGAEICVAACLTDSDCPELTVCSDSGWCHREGPGSGNPYCAGTPTSCASLGSGAACYSVLGCSDESECTGSATSCFSQLSSYSCISQDGCVWYSSGGYCSGSAGSCSSQPGPNTCASQQGCSWDENCTGTPWTCDEFVVSLCEEQPGCYVAND